MKNIIRPLLIMAIVSLAACNTAYNDEETSGTSSEELEETTTIKPSFVNADVKISAQVQHIYAGYLHVQAALAGDKSAEAATWGMRISELIKTFDTANLPADQKQAYEAQSGKIRESVSNMGNTRDITSQRAAFALLSDQVYELVKSFGNDKPVYENHCPMAFDGKGASWLSDKVKIRNPYYGSKMLECGDVVSVVKK